MSNSQYETYEEYGRPAARTAGAAGAAAAASAAATPAASAAAGHRPPVYDGFDVHSGLDVHSAQTVAFGMPGAYEDTYAPAYEALGGQQGRGGHEAAGVREASGGVREARETPEAALPRQAGRAVSGGALDEDVRAGASGRGARRRKVRSAERADSSVRRLLPQALVVAFLAGGTTAFVAKDKAIELTVDGKPRTLHTFADDVDELLAQEGVDVGAHDVVAPAPGSALTSGDEVAVHYGRPVRLTLDGHRSEVWTTAHTVQEALDQLGVRAEGAYMSVSRSQPIGRAGLSLDVRTERSVTVMADGRARTVRTNAATVRDVVQEAGVTLRGEDMTSVPGDSFPRDGQAVTVLRVTGSEEVREEPIPFETERTNDPTLFKGTEVVEQAGQVGLRRDTYALRTVNGVKQKPRRTGSEVVRKPRKQIVKVGTKPLPTSVQGADGLNWHGLAACESGGRPNAVDPSGTYGGLYQFDTRTWHSLGGSGRPQDATAEEQTFRAKKLYVRRGSSPWPHCGTQLHG